MSIRQSPGKAPETLPGETETIYCGDSAGKECPFGRVPEKHRRLCRGRLINSVLIVIIPNHSKS